MSFRNRYEFDPEAYRGAGVGSVLATIRAMLTNGDAGTGVVSASDRRGVLESASGEQAGLIDRLTSLQQEQRGSSPKVQPARNSVVDRIIAAESNGDANAANKRSTARGLGQFTEGTWLRMLAKYRPDLTGPRDTLLALRSDPVLSKQMIEALVAENAKSLARAGHEATPGNIYLAHFAGPAGAVAVLNADPNAAVRSLLEPRAIAANPFLEKMTAADLKAWADSKVSKAVPQSTSSALPERANPVFPRQLAPIPVPGAARTSTNDPSWPLDPRPISSLRGIDVADDGQDNRSPPSVGLMSGEPMQHWMMPIFDTRR